MIGISPVQNFVLSYKCKDCGNKFCLLFGLIFKKCPLCGGSRVKIGIRTVVSTCNPLDRLKDLIID